MTPHKRIGHVEPRPMADGHTAYRIIIPARNGLKKAFKKTVGWSNGGMNYERALELLDEEVFRIFGDEAVPIAARYQQFWDLQWLPLLTNEDKAVSASRLHDYKWVRKLVLKHFGESVECATLGDKKSIKGFVQWYCAKFPRKRTRSKIQWCLSPQLDYMQELGMIAANPFEGLKRERFFKNLGGKDDDPQFVPDTAQVRAILARIEPPFDLITLLSCCTGIGPAEVFGLRLGRLNLSEQPVIVDGFNLPRRSMLIAENCTRGVFGKLKTKNRKRTLPLPDKLIPLLRAHIETLEHRQPDSPLFQYYGQLKPFHIDNYGDRIDTVKETAGAPLAAPYCFRRFFATMCDRLLVPLEETKTMMGHSAGADMTRRYQILDCEKRRKYVNKIAAALLRN